ncbi:uncharacterized protein LOC108908245 isoform X2 [Anoplophora glabripennis]|uniref:uncharacterized protein LOC108908245 isoform X2 n=1 Tax=Anoplophora glabripennis TaxID=217634 RepID=UPI000874A5E5|nr:uncharacterized protein LOC108908245 isoform X2 [Anoplophora glabripennis]
MLCAVKISNNVTHYADEDFPSTESLKKATDYTEIDQIKNPTKEEQTAKPNRTTFSISVSTMKVANHTNSTTTVTTTEVIVDDSTSTKSQNMKFLNKVLSDVQELISYEKEGKSSGSNEGAMCTIVGDWDSKVGGMQLQIAARNESRRSPTVELVQQEPKAESGFLKTGKWNITTLMPFNHSSLIMLTAISEKSVASFLGR